MPVELTSQQADPDSKYIWEPIPSWNLHLHREKLPKTVTSTLFQERRRTYAKISIYPALLGKNGERNFRFGSTHITRRLINTIERRWPSCHDTLWLELTEMGTIFTWRFTAWSSKTFWFCIVHQGNGVIQECDYCGFNSLIIFRYLQSDCSAMAQCHENKNLRYWLPSCLNHIQVNSVTASSGLEVILDSPIIRLSKWGRHKLVIVMVLIDMGFDLYEEKK